MRIWKLEPGFRLFGALCSTVGAMSSGVKSVPLASQKQRPRACRMRCSISHHTQARPTQRTQGPCLRLDEFQSFDLIAQGRVTLSRRELCREVAGTNELRLLIQGGFQLLNSEACNRNRSLQGASWPASGMFFRSLSTSGVLGTSVSQRFRPTSTSPPTFNFPPLLTHCRTWDKGHTRQSERAICADPGQVAASAVFGSMPGSIMIA